MLNILNRGKCKHGTRSNSDQQLFPQLMMPNNSCQPHNKQLEAQTSNNGWNNRHRRQPPRLQLKLIEFLHLLPRQLRMPSAKSSLARTRLHSSSTNGQWTNLLSHSLHLPSVPFSLTWMVLALGPLAEARPQQHLQLMEPKKSMVRLAKSETLEQRPVRSLRNFSQTQPLRTRLR